MIILEGIDNTGKSTLADYLSPRLFLPIQRSEGPPHYPGEMNIRLQRYHLLGDVIFDRHPVVSQDIYGTMRSHQGVYDPAWRIRLYSSNPLFIYCDPSDDRKLNQHVVKERETVQHVDQVSQHYDDLLRLYRAWAIRHAHLIYRIGDNPDFILYAASAWRNQLCLIQSKTSPTSTRNSA